MYLLYLSIAVSILACLRCLYLHLTDKNKKSTYMMMSHLFTICACLSLCVVASKYKLRYIELAGTAIADSGFVVMAIANLSGWFEISQTLHLQELGLTLVYYIFYVSLLTTQFYNHLFFRAFWYFASTILCSVARYKHGDGYLIGYDIYPSFLFVTFELIFFTHMKVQVELFLSSQMIKI